MKQTRSSIDLQLETTQLQEELNRIKHKSRSGFVLRNTIFILVVVAAVAILVATLLLPVLQIYGSSMSPTLNNGEIVVSVKSSDFNTGDICAFYYNNKILVKRVIAGPGDWVDIDKDGTVYVNDIKKEEPYLKEKAFGDCDIKLPYQVPDDKFFVMGDHRSVSMDSRNSSIGPISQELIVGKIVFRVWPINEIGGLD